MKLRCHIPNAWPWAAPQLQDRRPQGAAVRHPCGSEWQSHGFSRHDGQKLCILLPWHCWCIPLNRRRLGCQRRARCIPNQVLSIEHFTPVSHNPRLLEGAVVHLIKNIHFKRLRLIVSLRDVSQLPIALAIFCKIDTTDLWLNWRQRWLDQGHRF